MEFFMSFCGRQDPNFRTILTRRELLYEIIFEILQIRLRRKFPKIMLKRYANNQPEKLVRKDSLETNFDNANSNSLGHINRLLNYR